MSDDQPVRTMKAILKSYDRTLARPFRDDVVTQLDEYEARIRELEGRNALLQMMVDELVKPPAQKEQADE